MAFVCYAAADDPRSREEQHFLAYEDASGNAALQQYLASLVVPEHVVLRSNTLQALLAAAGAGFDCALLPLLRSG